MNVETHEIVFSFDQPATILPSLLQTIQQTLAQQKTRSGRSVPLLKAHHVFIIDGQRERAAYISQALMLAGYQVLIASHALEAFTQFLQGSAIPLVIIQGQDDPTKRFFLQRLLQQMVQKYDVELALIKMHSPDSPSSSALSRVTPPHMHVTAPLPTPDTAPPASEPLTRLSPFRNPAEPITEAPFGTLPQFTRAHGLAPTTQGRIFPDTEETPFGLQLDFPPAPPQLPSPSLQTPAASLPFPPQSERPLPVLKKSVKKIALAGQSIGRYQIESVMGRGPFAEVYRAYDRLRETNVALKAIQTDAVPYFVIESKEEEDQDIFKQELTQLTSLRHSHIVPVLNTGRSYISGSPFVYKTMPFYSEGKFSDWLYQRGGMRPYAPEEVIGLIMQLADALQAAHDQQIIYQNFKPTNIFVKEPARDLRSVHLMLADFMFLPATLTLPSAEDALVYMAPERWEGQAVFESDQYALAVFAYELLTARPLFQGNNEQIMKRLQLTMQPQPPMQFNARVSAAANSVLLRALAKRPEERFTSISLFAQTLQRFCV